MFCARCWSFTSTDLVEGVVLRLGIAGICSNDWVNADNQPRAIEQRRLIFFNYPMRWQGTIHSTPRLLKQEARFSEVTHREKVMI
jgi:hypothetical protein